GGRVARVSMTDGAGDGGQADAASELEVRPRFTERDRAERLPDAELERGPAGVEVEIERGARAGEVLVDLTMDLGEKGVIFDPRAVGGDAVALALHEDAGETAAARVEEKRADGAVDVRVDRRRRHGV